MRALVLAAVMILLAGVAHSDEIAVTANGKKVSLKSDNTWEWIVDRRDEFNTAVGTVNSYLAATSWEDRLKYVANPEKAKPLMAKYYKNGLSVSPYEIITKPGPSAKDGEYVVVDVKFIDEADGSRNTYARYYLRKTRDGHKIDWAGSVGYNDVSPAEFKAIRHATPVRIRAYAKLDDLYYPTEFYDKKDELFSFRIINGKNDSYGYGYIGRNGKPGQELFKALRDGEWHPVVLEIRHNVNSNDGSAFVIDKVLNVGSWVVSDGHKK